MAKRNVLTKILAIAGTVLAWFPLAAPVLFSVVRMLQAGLVRFDYLMPAELFLVALVGGGLLLWAALRVRAYRALVAWSLGGAIALLVAGQLLAVVTGLASGATEPVGWPWALVVTSLALYAVALALLGTAGVMLLRDLFRPMAPSQ